MVETALGALTLPHKCFTAAPPVVGGAVTLCIRPEHFRQVDRADEHVLSFGEARIVGVAFFGTHYRCHLQPEATPDLTLVAHLPQSATVAEGDAIILAVSANDIVALPAANPGG